MAASKLLVNLSATFLCSYRVSSPSSCRLLSLYTFSRLNKCQSSLRFCTSSAVTTVVDSAPVARSDHEEAPQPLEAGHPWPEWDYFVDKLKSKGYFERAPTTTEVEGEGEGGNATMETNKLKNACLKFGRDRFDILSSLPKQDLRAIVECGCPSLVRKAVNSSKRLRAFLQIDEGDACGVCKLRGSCDKAYIAAKDEQVARTIDVIRVLLTYALEPSSLSGGEHAVQTNVQESARSLLTELIRLGDTTIDPSLPKPVYNVSSKKEEARELMPKASRNRRSIGAENRNRPSVGIEMKKGDWLCPKCNCLNFAKNTRCFECKEVGPKAVNPSEIPMKPGDWTCPNCQFMNFARNRTCFRCEEPHKRVLNFGEWECPSCNYVNFKRNQQCRRCNCDRPQENDGDQLKDRLWEKPKESFRESRFKFEDDSYGTAEEEDDGISIFDGYRNIGGRKRDNVTDN